MIAPRDLVAHAIAVATSRLGDDATDVLSRLAGAYGDRVRAAANDLAQLDESARKQRRAEVSALARSPATTALRGVHPTWIEAALEELPVRARTALAGGSNDPIDVWLARWAGASLVASSPHSIDRALDSILARDPQQILAWLTSIALDQLAFALGAAAASSLSAQLRDAATRITRAPRVNALGPHRAALVRCRGAALDDATTLLAIAGRALAPHFATEPFTRLHLTRRLSYADGIVIERELVAGAATSLDRVPAWAALIAT